MKKIKTDKLFEKRILFYTWLKTYAKTNSIFALKSSIQTKQLKDLPFNIKHNIALIIINDFIAINKVKKLVNQQLELFPLI